MVDSNARVGGGSGPVGWRRLRHAGSAALALVVLLVGVVATVAVGLGRRDQLRDEFEDRYAVARIESVAELQANVDRYASIIRAGGAFVVSSERVTMPEFERYGRSLDLAASARGIESIGFLEPVPWTEKERVEEELRDYRPDLQLAVGDVPRPLVLVTLSTSGPDRLGADLAGDVVRAEALERARSTGAIAMSAPVYRLEDLELPPAERPLGVALYAPVYSSGTVPETAAGRATLFRGWMATSFRLDDLVETLSDNENLVDIALTIDGSSSAVDLEGRAYVERESISLYGRDWKVAFAPKEALGTPSGDWRLVVWTGAVASASLAGIVALLATQRARLRRQVEDATREIATANRQLERDSIFQRALMANLQVGVILVDHRGRLETYNLDSEGLYLGRLEAGFEGSWSELLGLHRPDGTLLPEAENPMLRVLAGERIRDVEVLVRPTHGPEHVVRCNGQPIEDANGKPTGAVVTIHDITELKVAQGKLEQLARHDPLTGLANRALLGERLEHAIVSAARRNSLVALLFMDLDGFKAVNDLYGHDVGDDLLRVVAARLERTARSADTVARLGGDEFVVLCEDVSPRETLDHLTQRIVDALESPYELDRVPDLINVGVSIGVAFAEIDDDASSLLRRADERMYRAKAERRRSGSRR